MNKDIEIIEKLLDGNTKDIFINQIKEFYEHENEQIKMKKYEIGDQVVLKKGTLLHGTYKNLEGLEEIVKNGLKCSVSIENDRKSKYPFCVGVWNLKNDYLLKDYINFYSGGTIKLFNHKDKNYEISIVPYNEMNNVMSYIKNKGYLTWYMEQTKEARFLPSLIQDEVQIGIIFNGDTKISQADILNEKFISDEDVKPLVNEGYYERFIVDRKNKDDFFTDRESAIIYGIPSYLIEGILVGRKYENDKKILNEIKELVPNAYICNLDGIVIL